MIYIYIKQSFVIKKTLKNVENRELFYIQSYREVPENRQKLNHKEIQHFYNKYYSYLLLILYREIIL